MSLRSQAVRTLMTTGVVVLSLTATALAGERVGVVTTVEGTATVARVALLEAQPLRFRDDVYLHDRITTGERSTVRVLLGGKATVTARERSVVTITETPGVATIELSDGRISVAVSKAMMKRGEVIQIKTPNAVSAVRGTVVVAEVFPGATVRSTITVLRGLVDVTRLDAGKLVGLPVSVAALQSIQVTGSHPLAPPRAISPAEAQRLTSEFRVIPGATLSAAAAPAVRHAMDVATQDADALASKVLTSRDKKEPRRVSHSGRGSARELTSDGASGSGDDIGASGSTSLSSVNVIGGSGSLLNLSSGTSSSGSLLNVGIGGNSGPSRIGSSGSLSSGTK